MTVSTRANWKQQLEVNASKSTLATTDDPGSSPSDLSDLSDDEDSTTNAHSSAPTDPSKVEPSSSQPDTQPQSNKGHGGNHSSDPVSPGVVQNVSTDSVVRHNLSLGQSTYTDFLGDFSLLPTSTASPSATTTDDDQVFIAASLLTPIGSRLTYHSNPLSWSLFRPHSDKPSRILTEAHILQSLYLNASYANKRSVLLLEDPRYIEAQVKKMFITKPDSKLADYAHILLQVAVLDRFAWASLPLQTTDIHRHASESIASKLPENALSLIESCEEWQKVLATAAANFLVHEKPDKDSVPVNSSAQQSDVAVVSLGTRLAVSKNDTLVNHIEQNFISAAIALRALAEVIFLFSFDR